MTDHVLGRQTTPPIGSRMPSPVGQQLWSQLGGHAVSRGSSLGQDNPLGEWPTAKTRGVDRSFCSDLVVPQQCECILVVPVKAPAGTFAICDMNGRAVLHATTTSGPGGSWRLVLLTANEEPLAHCSEARHSVRSTAIGEGSVEFKVSDARDEYFASLVQLEDQRFELSTRGGSRLSFWGNFQSQAVNVTDFRGDLLATTEPCGVVFNQAGPFYKLRVAPEANVGHALCGLLCIGQILKPLIRLDEV